MEHSKLLVGGVAASPSAKNDRDVYIYIYISGQRDTVANRREGGNRKAFKGRCLFLWNTQNPKTQVRLHNQDCGRLLEVLKEPRSGCEF